MYNYVDLNLGLKSENIYSHQYKHVNLLHTLLYVSWIVNG